MASMMLVLCLFSTNDVFAGKCTGSSNCGACKNCSACKHCAQNGGSCGVCGGGASYQTERKPVKKVRFASSSSSTYSNPASSSDKEVGPPKEAPTNEGTNTTNSYSSSQDYNAGDTSTSSKSDGPSGWMYVSIILAVMYLYEKGSKAKTTK